MSDMREFLEREARKRKLEIFECEYGMPDTVDYKEHINPDAINGDAWLESNTSYIWKVGVLAAWDSNKCDWVNVFIGHHRKPSAQMEFIGHLFWRDGENDDIGCCLRRYLECMRYMHPVFEGDYNDQ